MNTAAKLSQDETGLRHPAEALHFLSMLAGTGRAVDDYGFTQPYPRSMAGGRTSIATNASGSSKFRYSELYNIPEEFRSKEGAAQQQDELLDTEMVDAPVNRDASQMSLGEILVRTNRHQGTIPGCFLLFFIIFFHTAVLTSCSLRSLG